jgi:hypothetical protein
MRRWAKFLDHIQICVLGCAFHIRWCLAWPGSALVATTWGWNLAGIKEGFGLRVAASDVQLWECTIFLWMTKPIYSFRAQLPVVRRERRFEQLPFTSLQDLMCCRDVYGVALLVHTVRA